MWNPAYARVTWPWPGDVHADLGALPLPVSLPLWAAWPANPSHFSGMEPGLATSGQ